MPEPPRDHLVGAVVRGDAEHGGGAEARVDQRRDEHRQRRPSGPRTTRPVSITGIVSASRELRSQPPERSCSSCSCTSGSDAHSSTSGWRGGDQHEARPRERVGVGGEDGQRRAPSGAAQVDLDAVDAPEHDLLGGERDLVPDAARGELVPGAGRSPPRRR